MSIVEIDIDDDCDVLESENDSNVSELGDFEMEDLPADDWTANSKKRKKIEFEKNPPFRNKQKRRLLRKLYVSFLYYLFFFFLIEFPK